MISDQEMGERPDLDTRWLRQTLAMIPGVDDWQLEVLDETEARLELTGLTGAQVESRRRVSSRRARITLYNDHVPRGGGGTVRGSSTITLSGDDLADTALVGARLRDAIAHAGGMDDPPFPLPGQPPGGFPEVQVADPVLADDPDGAADRVRARLEAAVAGEREVRLARARISATRGARSHENSRGLRGAFASTRVFLDLALIALGAPAASEFHAGVRRRRLEDLNIEELVAAYAGFVRDAWRAVPPPTARGPVILSGDALTTFFAPLVYHSSARAAYQRASRLTPGAHITGAPPRGDHLTLTSDAARPYGLRTAPFDADGLAAATVPLIEDGVLRQYWADARYAAYLGVPATGDFGNLTIEPGGAPVAALRRADGLMCEVVAFSRMHPDEVSGEFVAEITLGYLHQGGDSRPITGGSLSGNLFAALVDARLSAETYSDGSYYGPAAIRFGELTIAGG